MSEPFRNVLGSAGQPVEQWPYEALVAAIERGTLGDWVPIIRAIDQAPWGSVARQVEDYLGYASPTGSHPCCDRRSSAPARRRRMERVADRAGPRP